MVLVVLMGRMLLSLVESCIDNEIGFVFTPVFSKDAMDALKDETDDLVKEDGTIAEE